MLALTPEADLQDKVATALAARGRGTKGVYPQPFHLPSTELSLPFATLPDLSESTTPHVTPCMG